MAYVNNEDQGSGVLGRVFTALGKGAPDVRRGTLIQDAEKPIRELFSDYTKSLGSQTAGLQDFTKQYQALTPQLAGLDQLHSSTLGDLVTKAMNFNPTKFLQDSGNYLFGNLDKYLNQGLQAGTSAMNQALASGGYGDRAPSGYSALLNANRVTGNLLPAFNNIVANLTPLTNQQSSAYFQNLGQIPGWQAGQTNALQATPYRALVPSQIQQGQLAGNLGLLNNLVQGEMANSYFYNQPNGWQKLGNVFSGLYGGLQDAMDTASKAASTYGNIMTSGLGGQMGIGGGSAGQPEAPTSRPPSTGLGTVEMPGQGTGENYPLPSSSIPAGYYPQPQGYYPQAQANSLYGPLGIGGYSQYNPGSQVGAYLNQNPYAQYGAYF